MPATDRATDPAAAPARAVGALVVAAGAVAAVSGIWLAFAYRPDELHWLRTLHAGSSAVAVVSFISAWVVQRGGRLKGSARGLGLVAGLVVVLGGAFASGPVLAWKGGDGSDRGMLVGSHDGVSVDGHLVRRSELVVSFALHLGLSACAVALLSWHYVRSRADGDS